MPKGIHPHERRGLIQLRMADARDRDTDVGHDHTGAAESGQNGEISARLQFTFGHSGPEVELGKTWRKAGFTRKPHFLNQTRVGLSVFAFYYQLAQV